MDYAAQHDKGNGDPTVFIFPDEELIMISKLNVYNDASEEAFASVV